jgi:hypothetical protein
MDKENVCMVDIRHKEEENYAICREMDATEEHHIK